MRPIVVGALSLVLAACGGGGGGGGGSPPPPVASGACDGVAQISGDAGVAAGKTAGAVVLGCQAALVDVTWTQTAGPAVELVANGTQAVTVESATPGTVTLRADVRDATGASASRTVSIDVGAPPASSAVTLRGDQAVRPGGKVSIRAWPLLAAGDSVATLAWTQTAGPTVTLDTGDTSRILFTAPAVGADTLLKFRVTMTTARGATDSDDVQVVVENVAAPPSGGVFGGRHVSRVHPYQRSGAYASVLARCVYDAALVYRSSIDNNLCRAGELPLLAQDAAGAVPTVEQVMDRVLVSHDFMGANFEQFLRTQDLNGDFRRLLAGVSAVVIGAHVRPSFYHSATGAVYLDAQLLWLTPQQRDVIDEAPDSRSGFDRDLAYTGLWRYVLGNQYAQPSIALAARPTRTIDQLLYTLGATLYHELGHAGDYFPPSDRALDPGLSIYENALPRLQARLLASDLLALQFALTSGEMKGLARVKFFGDAATDPQRSTTAAMVGDLFRDDGASDEYNYAASPAGSNSREDLAMLFEEFMMSYRHGVQRDVAFTNKFQSGQTGADLIVAWGERGRIAQTQVKPRIRHVLQRIAPWIALATVDALPAPLPMRTGESWTANLSQPNAGAHAQPASALRANPRLWPVDPNDPQLIIDALGRRGHGPEHLPALP